MKKITLLVLLVSIISVGFTQQTTLNNFTDKELELKPSLIPRGADFVSAKPKNFNQKAFKDTLFFTTFPNGLPLGWSIVDNNSNGFQWTWDTIYRPGQFSQSSNVITSSSASDGFMSLTADLFNTPIPPTGAVPMDTYFESAVIDLTNNGANPNGFGSVWVSYQQTLRYCCSGANRLVLQVSTNNFATFQEYDATNAMALSAASGTVSNVIDISTAASNSATIKIRFLSEGNSHYYWMIDDFAVIEGPDFDMKLSNAFPEFNSTYTINPFYSQIPLALFNNLNFSGIVTNEGGSIAPNARLEVSVINDSLRATPISPLTAGLGLTYLNQQLSNPANLPPNVSDTLVVGSTTPFITPGFLGNFSINFLANSDSTSQNPSNETETFSFAITESTLAKDDGILGGDLSPGNFVRGGVPGGTAAGDQLTTLFVIESNPTSMYQMPFPISVSFLVSNDISNVGVELIPVLYEFNENATTVNAAFGHEVASSFIPYIVQTSDLNNWVTVIFDNGRAFFNGLAAGQYAVGWKTTSITGGTNFSVQEDLSLGSKQPMVSTFINFGHDTLGWGFISPTNPGIRLNFGPPIGTTSIDEVSKIGLDFSITPNPNNGLFNIEATTGSNAQYVVTVRTILGQSIYNESISINSELTKTIDLSTFEKGVYFVSLENDLERMVKKIIVQ